MREIVGLLIARKLRLFPDDSRMVVSFELAPTAAGLHLLVASTPVGPSVTSLRFADTGLAAFLMGFDR